MVAAALIRDRHSFASALSTTNGRLIELRALLQIDGVAMGVFLAAAVLIESQNAGSQEFAFLIPAVLYVLVRSENRNIAARATTLLAAAFLLIVAVKATHRAFLITSHVDRFPRLEAGLQPFHISARLADIEFAEQRLKFYSAEIDAYRRFASGGQDLTANIDEGFQLSYFLSVRNGVQAVHRWQTRFNVHLESVAALDFVDPFPTLLGLRPVPGLGIVRDPYRAIGQTTTILRSLSSTEGILVPLCPVNSFRYQLAKIAKLEIERRQAISIDPCWTLYVRKLPTNEVTPRGSQ